MQFDQALLVRKLACQGIRRTTNLLHLPSDGSYTFYQRILFWRAEGRGEEKSAQEARGAAHGAANLQVSKRAVPTPLRDGQRISSKASDPPAEKRQGEEEGEGGEEGGGRGTGRGRGSAERRPSGLDAIAGVTDNNIIMLGTFN